MDFEFRKDTLTDTYRVIISMEQTALGNWIQGTLGTDKATIALIQAEIDLLKARQKQEYRLIGDEMTLTLTQEDVCACANSELIDFGEELDDDMNFYDAETVAVCGLEDFEILLQAWLRFFSQR
ncbi:YacL family protein [Moritella viscosa]|uniref:Uncharacterized protein n=1 Tax=Moritella viscosa TaxID=80854 RepID=A0A1L0EC54_9GAMM|nr:YacL family protein [Moritella viscosa]SGY91983.1 Putative uncharacterized protein [Moritella viscosa]SGY96345.1 Putative uncharacterized protein [Moritella viscosa]SGY96775.1 Putative uncharacterized protein [Moritella viscosa]SGZ01936.1 Putative uncharacterized protein [Moritella viscosa]SGZ02387.1 Putative uncharacterized protein [Moritella viscosa]